MVKYPLALTQTSFTPNHVINDTKQYQSYCYQVPPHPFVLGMESRVSGHPHTHASLHYTDNSSHGLSLVGRFTSQLESAPSVTLVLPATEMCECTRGICQSTRVVIEQALKTVQPWTIHSNPKAPCPYLLNGGVDACLTGVHKEWVRGE